MILQRRLMWAMFVMTLIVSVLYVRTRFFVVQLSYQVHSLQKERDLMEQKKEMYQLQISMAKSPSRIQKIALEKLGLSGDIPSNTTVMQQVAYE